MTKIRTDDAKITGYGSIEFARGLFRQRLDKANWPDVTQPLKVIIEATIQGPNNNCDDVGQEFRLEIGKVTFK